MIINKIRYYYHKFYLVKCLLTPVLTIKNIFFWYILPEKTSISCRFKNVFGFFPDFNNPKTLNEKIQWLKLNDRTPLHTLCADKFRVREYVERAVGEQYLVPLYFQTKDLNDIPDKANFEFPAIIKTNHDSGGGIFIFDEKNDWDNIKKILKKRLSINYYNPSKEWPYKNIEPCVIVEKLLECENGDIPYDYKIHCFNGKPKYIQVDLDRFSDHKRNIYDIQWNIQPFTWSAWKDGKPLWPNGRSVEKPSTLNEMLDVAEKLAKPFFYSRIDFYDVDGKVYFGEITFHHGSGREIIYPKVWDKRLGYMMKLPHEHWR